MLFLGFKECNKADQYSNLSNRETFERNLNKKFKPDQVENKQLIDQNSNENEEYCNKLLEKCNTDVVSNQSHINESKIHIQSIG